MNSNERVYKLVQKEGEYILIISIVENEVKIIIKNNKNLNQVYTYTYTVDIIKNIHPIFKSTQRAVDFAQWIDNAMKIHKVNIYKEGDFVKLIFKIFNNGEFNYIQIPIYKDNKISSTIRSTLDTLLFYTSVTSDSQSKNLYTQEFNKTPKTPIPSYNQIAYSNDKNVKPFEIIMKKDNSKYYSPQIKLGNFSNNEGNYINLKNQGSLEGYQKFQEIETGKIINNKITTSYENIKNTNLELESKIKELNNKLLEKDTQVNMYIEQIINITNKNNEINILLKNYQNQIFQKGNEILELQKKLKFQAENISYMKNNADLMTQNMKNKVIELEKVRKMISILELENKKLKMKYNINQKNEEMKNKTINDLKKVQDEINKNYKEEKIIYENKIKELTEKIKLNEEIKKKSENNEEKIINLEKIIIEKNDIINKNQRVINELNKYNIILNQENDKKLKEIEQRYTEKLMKEKENIKLIEEKYRNVLPEINKKLEIHQVHVQSILAQDRPENLFQPTFAIEIVPLDKPEIEAEPIDEIELCSKDRPENIIEPIDEIILFSEYIPENISAKENEHTILIIVMTKDEKVILPIMLKNTEKLKKMENLFYKEYPEYLLNKGQFYFHNILLNTYNTLEKYKIKNNDIILFEQK